MTNFLAALLAGAFAIVASAQTLAPAPATPAKPTATERRADVKSMTTAEKNKAIKDANKAMIGNNPVFDHEKSWIGDDTRGYSADEIRAGKGRGSTKAVPGSTPDIPARDPQR